MEYQEYIDIFVSKNEYISRQRDKVYFIKRLLNRNRFHFYYRFAKVILKGARVARKGLYDKRAWIENSLDNLIFLEKSGGQFIINGLDNLREDKKKEW